MKLYLILLILLTFQGGLAEKPLIEGRFTLFTTDELGNIYTLNKDELELYRPDGGFWMRNSIKTIGTIHSMDAFYSLKPMLFSQELQQLAVLDNTLSIQGDLIWLNRRGFPQVTLTAASVQNHFWLYDQLDMQLIRVDRQWRRVSESGRIDQLLGFTPEPTEMLEHDNLLYLNDPENGLLVFDLFGTYVKTIPLLNVSHVQVGKQKITFMQKGACFTFDRLNFDIEPIDLPEGVRMFRHERGRILYLSDSGINEKKL